jgi:hypothetical protein
MFKSFLEWIGDHSGLAAGIQAIGIIGSVWVVFYVSRTLPEDRDQELNRAKGLVTQLKTVLQQFRRSSMWRKPRFKSN